MAQGLLKVQGRIPLEEFWPEGEFDADTAIVKVEVGAAAFRFREHPGASFHVMRKARFWAGVTKDIIDEKGWVTIRLQGVDAPELHYMPQAAMKKRQRTRQGRKVVLEWNPKYRQHLAESATVALKTLLQAEGRIIWPARFGRP